MFRRAALHALTLLPLSALTLLRPRPALAFPVIDVGSIAQVTAQIATTIAQIEAVKQQVQYLRNAAERLDPRSYQSVAALLSGDAVTFDSITRDANTISYTLDGVNRQFRRMFPDEDAVRDMRPSEHAEAARQMNREIHGAALVSHRAQTSVATLEQSHAQARDILRRSDAEDSQVAQLQSAVQMLSIVHSNLANITQTVAAAGRVTSDIAAAEVTENRITAERQRRSIEGFDRMPETFTGIDSSFLGE